MVFDESFFKEEVRDGFLIEEMMKRAWAAQIEVLKEVEKFCKRHNINYYAEWGTLLGAVRHKGFIPWDDDIDICMKREDYQILLKYGMEELPEGYYIINPYTDAEFGDPFTRVVNSRYINTTEPFLQKYHGCPFAVGLDIFPLDYIPADGAEHDLQHALIQMAIVCKSALKAGENAEDSLCQLEEYCNYHFDSGRSILQQLNILIDSLCAMYKEEECRYIGPVHHYVVYGDCRMEKSCYQEPVWLPFENTEIAVPTDYLRAVREEFGEDYMTPVKSHLHDYPFYKGQQEILEKMSRK